MHTPLFFTVTRRRGVLPLFGRGKTFPPSENRSANRSCDQIHRWGIGPTDHLFHGALGFRVQPGVFPRGVSCVASFGVAGEPTEGDSCFGGRG